MKFPMQMLFWTVIAPLAFVTTFRLLNSPGVLAAERIWPNGLPPVAKFGTYVLATFSLAAATWVVVILWRKLHEAFGGQR